MTTFTLTSPAFRTYTGTMELVTVAPRYVGFRALHRSEVGRQTPDGMPCVVPSSNVAGILFTQEMQLLSYALVSAVMSKDKWRVVYGKGQVDTER